ncbi:MAG: tetratricopeptide repeat protein, partial [Flavobacteriales bacterium]|nr:tetratricopeptide repeat protein [Flavobacteriales bacterium]
MMGYPLTVNSVLAVLLLLAASCNMPGGGDRSATQEGGGELDSLSAGLFDLEQRIVADPSDPALFAERARFYLRFDSTDQAINDLRRALALDSTNARYQLALGEAYYLSLQVAQALPRFERAIELD